MPQVVEIKKIRGQLIGHLFEPKQDLGKFVLINSATGVRQQIYFKFAEFLASKGFTVLTYDYEGIGKSKPVDLKACPASMRSWGSEDYPAVTKYIAAQFPEHEKYLLGHSIGALILGMNPDSHIFKKFIFISTQFPYLSELNLKTKLTAILGFDLALPLTGWLKGYFPAQWFGLGESLPLDVARDWRTLILNKKSIHQLLESTLNISKELTQETLVLRADDDGWLTAHAVEKLLTGTFPNLKPTYRLLKSEDSPQHNIGHINFFRGYNEALWSVVLEGLK